MSDRSDRVDPHRLLVERIQQEVDYELDCERLYLAFRQPLLRFFKHRGFSREDGEDLTQLTFIRVFTGIGTFQFESLFATWLFEIATNVWHNEHRRATTVKRQVLEEDLDEQAERHADARLAALVNSGSAAPDPLLAAIEHENLDTVRAALDQFPPQMRRCLLMRLNGFKYREVAEVMKLSIDTVKAHLHQARQRLLKGS